MCGSRKWFFNCMSSEAISKLWLLPHRKDSFYILCCFMNICRCFTAYCGYVAWYGLWIILIIRVWTFIIVHALVHMPCATGSNPAPWVGRPGIIFVAGNAPVCARPAGAVAQAAGDAIMATCSTAGCHGKPRGGETECDKCKHNVVDLIDRDNIIINELLMYANQHRQKQKRLTK